MRKNGKYYFFEMAHRLDGGAFWKNYKRVNHFSSLELMVDLALGRSLSVDLREDADFNPKENTVHTMVLGRIQGKLFKLLVKKF